MHPLTKQKLQATGIVCVLFVLLTVYTVVRHQLFDLWLFNKILAGISGILLGVVVVTGVLSRLYNFFDRMLMYRKWLGIAAFLSAYLHGMITLFLLPEQFPASRFHLGNLAFVMALLSLGCLSVLFVFSFQKMIDGLDRHVWWKVQNWGVRIALLTGLFHAIIVKLPAWTRWFNGQDLKTSTSFLPPAGLLITSGILLVVAIRLLEFAKPPIAKKVITVLCILEIVVVCLLFAWGLRFR